MWESARLTSIFLASGFFLLPNIVHARHTQLTQTVSRLRAEGVSMVATPTFEFRWYESDSHDEEAFVVSYSYGSETKFVLQQKWVLQDGSFEWRKIEVVYLGG